MPGLKRYLSALQQIRSLAESCARQLAGWAGAIEQMPFEGQRHLPSQERRRRETAQNARAFRLNFLRNLKPDHPLYHSPEAREARGEPAD